MAGLNLFTNNASTTLASNVLIGATSLTVAAGTGSLFPALAGSQYFYCTLTNAAATLVEIVKVTARSTDTFTIVRGQDNTSAQAWTAGDKVELRLVDASLENFPQLDSTNTFAAAQTFSATPVFSAGITSTATPVSVASGGTGLGTLTANNVILGNGASAPNFVAPGTAGNVLSSNGTTWVSTTPASGSRSGADYLTLSVGTPNITLTSSSNQVQVVTATALGQTITLPDMTTCTKGLGYFTFYNTSAFPIGVKDAGGTIREYLYPSSSNTYANSPIQSVDLIIQENATANGVWHLQNPISAGIYGASTNVASSTTFTSTVGGSALYQLTPIYYIIVTTNATGNTLGTTPYIKLATLNPTTKAFTFGSQITLSSANAGIYNSLRPGGGFDTDGVSRGLLVIAGYSYYGGQTINSDVYGVAVVSGVLYVSGNQRITIGTSAASSGSYSNTPGVMYNGADNAFTTANYFEGGVNKAISIYSYKVNVSGTTVTLSGATGNGISYSNTSSYTYSMSPTSKTTYVVDDTNNTTKTFINYNTSTNTLTSGNRTSQTTRIAGNLTTTLASQASLSYITGTSGRVFYGSSIATVTNPGTATVTVTNPNYNLKSFPAKSYASVTTGASMGTFWPTSASSYSILSGTTLFNCDPSNADFNFNQASLTVYNSENYWYDANTIISVGYSTDNITTVYLACDKLSPAVPFVS